MSRFFKQVIKVTGQAENIKGFSLFNVHKLDLGSSLVKGTKYTIFK